MVKRDDVYENLLRYIYEKKWPIVSKFMSESLRRFMGEKRIGIFGDFTEGGNGWSKMEFIARELANMDYSVLTGKSVFKKVKDIIVEFPFLLGHIAQLVVETRIYCKWLVRQCPQAIILHGKYRATSTYEEEEAYDAQLGTYGIAIIDNPKNVDLCKSLDVLTIDGIEFYICTGKVGDCLINKERYCSFIKKGTPLGTIDLYIRKPNMHLMATEKQENIIKILYHLNFLI